MDKTLEATLMSFIPKPVKKIATVLNSAGFDAFIVGGAIRDIVIGQGKPKEWDMATSAKPGEISLLFEKIYKLGEKFGTITVIMDDLHVEVTTFRSESGYTDRRHPQKIDFISDIRQDLSRRDFTINAMAFDPINGDFLDLFGGIEDIKRKTIKTVGDPKSRFSEDGLRMMRAVRLATVLKYDLDEETFEAIVKLSSNINDISKERIRDEIIKILTSSEPGKGLLLLKDTNLLTSIFPNAFDLNYLHEAASACETIRNNFDMRISLAMIIMKASPEEVLPKLKLPKKEAKRIKKLISMSKFSVEEPNVENKLREFALLSGREEFFDALTIQKVLGKIDGNVLKLAEKLILEDIPFSINDLKISGTDLIDKYELKPGIRVKRILESLLEEVSNGRLKNEYEELMIGAKKFIDPEMGEIL